MGGLLWLAVYRPLSPLLSFTLKYREILQRVAVTVAMLAIMRAGMFVPLPGVDLAHLQPAAAATEGRQGGGDADTSVDEVYAIIFSDAGGLLS